MGECFAYVWPIRKSNYLDICVISSRFLTMVWPQAVAALWEHQETEIEAVHMAIALAYHGLLRVPSRAESSEVTARE
jgi:hypothetical protein